MGWSATRPPVVPTEPLLRQDPLPQVKTADVRTGLQVHSRAVTLLAGGSRLLQNRSRRVKPVQLKSVHFFAVAVILLHDTVLARLDLVVQWDRIFAIRCRRCQADRSLLQIAASIIQCCGGRW